MSSLRKLAGQTALYGISSILGRFVNWGLTPFYTRILSPEDYGVMTDLYAYTSYFLVILTFGMETAFFRYTMDKKDWRSVYDQSLLFVTLMGMGFILLSVLNLNSVSTLAGQEGHQRLILWNLLIIFVDVVSALPMARFRFEEKATLFAGITLTSIVVNVCLSIIFVNVLKLGLEWVFIANLISSLVKLGMALPFTLPETWRLNGKLLRPMTGFGFYIMVAGLLGMLTQNLEKNLIPRLWEDGHLYNALPMSGDAMLGLYSAGYKLAMIILLATQAFRYAAEPFFFRHARESKSRTIYARVFHYYWLICMAVFVLVGVFTPQIAAFHIGSFSLIGKKFWGGLDVVPLLLMSYSLFGAYSNLSIWFKLTKQTRFGLLFSGIGVLIILLMNWFMIPHWGYMGSAWASVVCFTVMGLLVYYSGQKYYPIPYRMDRAAVLLLIALLTFFIAMHYMESPWYRLLTCMAGIGMMLATEKLYPIQWGKGFVQPETPAAAPEQEIPGAD